MCVCVCEAAAAAPVEEEADIRNYCVTMIPNGEIDLGLNLGLRLQPIN
jgi:hypothetical protein